MKTSLPSTPRRVFGTSLSLLFAASLGISTQAQTPLFEARFNDATSMNLLSGATLGKGVSGQRDDYSYTASASTTGAGQKGPSAMSAEHNPVTNLEQFTITVWYKPQETVRNDATLFDLLGTVLIWEEKTDQWVLRVDTKPSDDKKPSSYWFRSGDKPPLGGWAATGTWNFVAMVWKKSDKKVVFYQGSDTTQISLAKESVRPEDVLPLNEHADAKRVVGNTVANAQDRPFDGSIDDLRFYDRALDEAAIEKIRQADLKNKAPALP